MVGDLFEIVINLLRCNISKLPNNADSCANVGKDFDMKLVNIGIWIIIIKYEMITVITVFTIAINMYIRQCNVILHEIKYSITILTMWLF